MDSLDKIRRLIRETELQIRSAAHVEADGISANHRAQYGPPPATQYTHVEQYDAVLRHHLGMKPASDPHEEARRMHAAIQAARNPQSQK